MGKYIREGIAAILIIPMLAVCLVAGTTLALFTFLSTGDTHTGRIV